MTSKTHKNLVFLERQFNTIKKLIPSANEYVSQSVAPEKLVRSYFRIHVSNWDILNSEEKQKLHGVNLSESESRFLSEQTVLIMNLLVHLKRNSKEAKNSQQSFKITLYELLVRLRSQVMNQSPVKIVPSFMQIESDEKKSELTFLNNLNFKRLATKKKKENSEAIGILNSFEIPEFMSKVLKEKYAHLEYLSTINKGRNKYLENELEKYKKLKMASLKKKKEYEAKAFEIMVKMISVEKELNECLRNQSKPLFESFVTKMQEKVNIYIDKA